MIKKLFSLFSNNEKKKFLIILFLMIIGACMEAIGISLIIPILDTLSNQGQYIVYLKPLTLIVEDSTSLEFALLLFICLAVFFTIKNLYLLFMFWAQYRFIYKVRANLSYRVFSFYLNQSISFHKSKNSSKLFNTLVNDTNIFGSHAIFPILTIITESLVLMAIIILLALVEPAGTITLCLLLGIVLTIFNSLLKPSINNWGEQRIIKETARVKGINQGLGSIKDILLRSAQKFFLIKYNSHNMAVASILTRQSTVQTAPRLIFETSVILLLCLYIFIEAKNNTDIVEVVKIVTIFAFAAIRLMPSISRLSAAIQNFRFSYPVIENLYNDRHSFDLKDFEDPLLKEILFKDKINLFNVSYKYDNSNKEILKNFSNEITAGECIGIVGKSGSGKSTLGDMILGFIEPTSGQIFIDGVPLKSIVRQWQKKIGFVPQDVYLLDESIKSNIAFGIDNENINKEQVMRAIEMSQLKSFLDELPNGIDTIVGEQGSKLSGGQIQRLGIARALYNNPDLIIFDEATSSLDNQTEKDFVKAINALKGKITIIVIAHRESALSSCDRIIDLTK